MRSNRLPPVPARLEQGAAGPSDPGDGQVRLGQPRSPLPPSRGGSPPPAARPPDPPGSARGWPGRLPGRAALPRLGPGLVFSRPGPAERETRGPDRTGPPRAPRDLPPPRPRAPRGLRRPRVRGQAGPRPVPRSQPRGGGTQSRGLDRAPGGSDRSPPAPRGLRPAGGARGTRGGCRGARSPGPSAERPRPGSGKPGRAAAAAGPRKA